MSDVDSEEQVEHWRQVLDFVATIADWLDLSGWSIGVVEGGLLRLHSRGFDDEVAARYAELALGVHLPGPVTMRTGRDQYFPTRETAHASYPLAAEIDGGTRHVAAATLVLWGRHGAAGYVAFHFARPQTFDDAQRARLERLVASIAAVMPVPAHPGTVDVASPMVLAMQQDPAS